MAAAQNNPLVTAFTDRLVNDLAGNATLRGAWAEHLVAHFLGIDALSPSWSYHDMRDGFGRDISVKHSVGPKPKFSVKMQKWAWDLDNDHTTEGWYVTPEQGLHYWCHTYVFAWLPAPTATPDVDYVLDAGEWRFAVLSREQMYAKFTRDGEPVQQAAGLGAIGSDDFAPGSELPRRVNDTPFADEFLNPPRVMVRYQAAASEPA